MSRFKKRQSSTLVVPLEARCALMSAIRNDGMTATDAIAKVYPEFGLAVPKMPGPHVSVAQSVICRLWDAKDPAALEVVAQYDLEQHIQAGPAGGSAT